MEGIDMEKSQKIYCEVESCKFNTDGNICNLKEIQVKPIWADVNVEEADESMCASYEKEEN